MAGVVAVESEKQFVVIGAISGDGESVTDGYVIKPDFDIVSIGKDAPEGPGKGTGAGGGRSPRSISSCVRRISILGSFHGGRCEDRSGAVAIPFSVTGEALFQQAVDVGKEFIPRHIPGFMAGETGDDRRQREGTVFCCVTPAPEGSQDEMGSSSIPDDPDVVGRFRELGAMMTGDIEQEAMFRRSLDPAGWFEGIRRVVVGIAFGVVLAKVLVAFT